jgi:hypothetical protein
MMEGCRSTRQHGNSTARDTHRSAGMIGFDIASVAAGSESRTQGHLVNDPWKTIGADAKRTDFALAA